MERLGIVVAVTLCGGLAYADAPRTQKQQEADKLFAEGRDLLVNKKDPKAACEKFELAAADDPTAAGTMLNLGLCYEELGKIHTALKWFRRAQTQASESNLPDHEKAAKDHTDDLSKKVPVVSIAFVGPPPVDAHVRIDADEISLNDLAHVEVDPGEHVVEVRAPHHKLSRQRLTFALKDPAHQDAVEVKVAMEPGEPTSVVDRGRNRRLVAYGLGAVALGAWTFDFFYGLSKSRNYHCAVDVSPDSSCSTAVAGDTNYANAQVHSLKVTGNIVFFAGAAALAAGAYLFFTAPGKVTVENVSGERLGIAPLLAPDQVGLAITGGF